MTNRRSPSRLGENLVWSGVTVEREVTEPCSLASLTARESGQALQPVGLL